jgi:hypothetical protein
MGTSNAFMFWVFYLFLYLLYVLSPCHVIRAEQDLPGNERRMGVDGGGGGRGRNDPNKVCTCE